MPDPIDLHFFSKSSSVLQPIFRFENYHKSTVDREQMADNKAAGSSEQVDTFKKLKVWQKAHELTMGVYQATKSFPRDEMYGMISQIRRAALSTSTNIVEGSRRRTRNDFRHFLNMAQGSNEEVKYLLLVSRELNYLPAPLMERLAALADEVGAMLYAFIA
jgi:four helix bundle protein